MARTHLGGPLLYARRIVYESYTRVNGLVVGFLERLIDGAVRLRLSEDTSADLFDRSPSSKQSSYLHLRSRLVELARVGAFRARFLILRMLRA